MFDTIFLGTAPFGFPVMRALKNHDYVNVLGIFTQPDRKRGRGQELQSPPVAEYARELDFPLMQPEDINEDGKDMIEELGKIDLSFVVAYGQFLDPEVFNLPAVGTFNFHASLLPRWRGAAPIRHTLLSGDEQTGVSIFRLAEGMDTGPVCSKIRTNVEANETYGELYERLSEMNVGALKLFLEDLKNDRLECRSQQGEATYATRIDSDDARIDWDDTATEIERQIRAFCPDPGAFFTRNGERIKVFRAEVIEQDDSGSPGEVVQCDKEELIVHCGEGNLSIRELQPAGSTRMDVESYLAGQPNLSSGDRMS